jgi:hypothetical protein
VVRPGLLPGPRGPPGSSTTRRQTGGRDGGGSADRGHPRVQPVPRRCPHFLRDVQQGDRPDHRRTSRRTSARPGSERSRGRRPGGPAGGPRSERAGGTRRIPRRYDSGHGVLRPGAGADRYPGGMRIYLIKANGRRGHDDPGEGVTVVEDLAADERPLRTPFWSFTEPGEERTVDRVLRRRFPDAYSRLAAALAEADPMDVVYPGNPGEYHDVVRRSWCCSPGGTAPLTAFPSTSWPASSRTDWPGASAKRPTAGPFAGWRNYCSPPTEPQMSSARHGSAARSPRETRCRSRAAGPTPSG